MDGISKLSFVPKLNQMSCFMSAVKQSKADLCIIKHELLIGPICRRLQGSSNDAFVFSFVINYLFDAMKNSLMIDS